MKLFASVNLVRAFAFSRHIDPHYRLDVVHNETAALAKGWLGLAVGALVGSGVFSLLLVLSRTPGVNRLFPAAEFFRVALVVHVDLSVLVWFAAFAGMLWSLAATRRSRPFGWLALALCATGTAGMCLSPFAGNAAPVMANYIPVLASPIFMASLLVFGAGVAVMVLSALWGSGPLGVSLNGPSAIRLGLLGAAASVAVALFAFLWSWLALPMTLDAKTYYELLFWGGGHVLQFTWTLLLLVSWLWLASATGARLPFTPRVVVFLFSLALLLVLATPVIYLLYDVTSVEHRRLLTWTMRVGGGLSILPLALGLAIALAEHRAVPVAAKPARAALIMSLALFALGGLIGFTIDGSNVKIPAHYHGCIVGITLAFMGVAYDLLPRLGFAAPTGRLANWQPYVYGIGQLMHISGLVWSGGYGVERKVAGADQFLGNIQQVAGMGLMGLGGLIAIAGGIVFIVVVARSVYASRARGTTLSHRT
ncbi:MAG: cbb3-type cytochrome c oxidase subunit I [Burkholderiales bacterium]